MKENFFSQAVRLWVIMEGFRTLKLIIGGKGFIRSINVMYGQTGGNSVVGGLSIVQVLWRLRAWPGL